MINASLDKCLNGLFQENTNRGVEDIEFPGVGYQRNSMWNFQGLIKNEVGFPRVTKKK